MIVLTLVTYAGTEKGSKGTWGEPLPLPDPDPEPLDPPLPEPPPLPLDPDPDPDPSDPESPVLAS